MSPIYVPGKLILANEPFRGITATGGDSVFDISFNGIRYRVHVFTSTGSSTFAITDIGSGLHPAGLGAANTVEYLIIGGGSGGNGGTSNVNYGNGGAAGVARDGTFSVADQSYNVVVGAGSAGVKTTDSLPGGPSSIFGVTATGGDTALSAGRTGASNADYSGGTNSTGTNSGGGGGAAANGSSSVGGDGYSSDITGVSVVRGGGGGGVENNVGAAGGDGGGGKGNVGGVPGANGIANTGSGGGGGTASAGGGDGGSGIVIVRYAI